jgi:hypothetical protein
MGLVKEFLEFRKAWHLRGAELEFSNFAVGVNSTVNLQEDLHLVMLDFDIDDLDKVRDSVRELQEFWKLTDAYVYKTMHGYHVIFWHSHVPYTRLRQIIDFAKFVDPMYKYISQQHNHKTLRSRGKYENQDIVFERIIPGVRNPSKRELELGELKMKEHADLMKIEDMKVRRK